MPLMRKTFVEKLHWIDEGEMMDFTAIAQSTPGAMAVNASILVGYRMAGVPGALVTVGGTVLPPLIIISVISLFYQAFRANPIVNLAMTGMLAGVAAVLCDVVYTMARSVLRPGKWVLPAVLMVLSFLAVAVGGGTPSWSSSSAAGWGRSSSWPPGGRGREGGSSCDLPGTAVEFCPDRPVQHRRGIRRHAPHPAPGGGPAPLADHDPSLPTSSPSRR